MQRAIRVEIDPLTAGITRVRRWAAARVPDEAAAGYRLEVTRRGRVLTITRHPPSGDRNTWSRWPLAQLRLNLARRSWTLWWLDRNGRWRLYDDVNPTRQPGRLLTAIDNDPDGVFFG
jgi:hypothetical protein